MTWRRNRNTDRGVRQTEEIERQTGRKIENRKTDREKDRK